MTHSPGLFSTMLVHNVQNISTIYPLFIHFVPLHIFLISKKARADYIFKCPT